MRLPHILRIVCMACFCAFLFHLESCEVLHANFMPFNFDAYKKMRQNMNCTQRMSEGDEESDNKRCDAGRMVKENGTGKGKKSVYLCIFMIFARIVMSCWNFGENDAIQKITKYSERLYSTMLFTKINFLIHKKSKTELYGNTEPMHVCVCLFVLCDCF